MISTKNKFQTIDEYIDTFPKEIQTILEHIRNAIKEAVPEVTEVISYQMPAFKLNSVLVYFATYKNHIGFYPTSKPIKEFSKEFSSYKTSKGAIQFPLDKPMPLNLIKKITKFRVKEILNKDN